MCFRWEFGGELRSLAGGHGKAVLTVGGSTEEVATSNSGQGDEKGN